LFSNIFNVLSESFEKGITFFFPLFIYNGRLEKGFLTAGEGFLALVLVLSAYLAAEHYDVVEFTLKALKSSFQVILL